MADFSVVTQDYNRVTISTASTECIGTNLLLNGAVTSSNAFPAANRAIFIPFTTATPIVIVKIAVVNGTAVSGNVDVGIYDAQQNRLVSMGSVAQAGTTAVQSFDITDTTLYPGTYYMALSCDNTTATFARWAPMVPIPNSMGVLSQSLGSVTLPDPATFAAAQDAWIPFMYLTRRTLI